MCWLRFGRCAAHLRCWPFWFWRWANNVPEWVLVQMGAALAGVTLVTVNPALRREEVKHVLGHSEAVLFTLPGTASST
jgi:hypothetical protein